MLLDLWPLLDPAEPQTIDLALIDDSQVLALGVTAELPMPKFLGSPTQPIPKHTVSRSTISLGITASITGLETATSSSMTDLVATVELVHVHDPAEELWLLAELLDMPELIP